MSRRVGNNNVTILLLYTKTNTSQERVNEDCYYFSVCKTIFPCWLVRYQPVSIEQVIVTRFVIQNDLGDHIDHHNTIS